MPILTDSYAHTNVALWYVPMHIWILYPQGRKVKLALAASIGWEKILKVLMLKFGTLVSTKPSAMVAVLS